MFKQITEAKVNDLHFKNDEDSGLKSIIAIHSTARGPALGGCRIISYGSSQEAITDVIRLAKGMSYKAALAGLDLGGGKAVILEPSHEFDREKLFKAFGLFVEELNGRYITAMDSGTTVADMDYISKKTSHVTCTSSSNGNPAFYTAKGVFLGIKACLEACSRLKKDLSDIRIAVQGLGNVGYELCKMLYAEGAQLFVSDINDSKISQCIKEFSATGVPADQIYQVPCDIFSPCGLGGVLSPQVISELQCKAVAGSANNQLLTPECGGLLLEKNILYAPDYLINAGGLIAVAASYKKMNMQKLNSHIEAIQATLLEIFKKEEQSKKPSSIIANDMAEAILLSRTSPELCPA